MFSIKKISQEIKEYLEDKEKDPLTSERYSEHYNALLSICKLISWRLSTLQNVLNKEVPLDLNTDNLKDYGKIHNFILNSKQFIDSLKIVPENAKGLVAATKKLFDKANFHIPYLESYSNKLLKNIENKRKIEESKYAPEEITTSDDDYLYESKKDQVSYLTQLIQAVNFTASMVHQQSDNLSQRSINEDANFQKQRFNILQKVNNQASAFLKAVNDLYKYTKENNIKIGKQTWNAKNVIGLIRAVVSEQEYVMYLNNLNQAAKTLYLIE